MHAPVTPLLPCRTTAQLEELKQAFDLFDEDESETIDRHELARVIKLFQGEAPSDAELQAMIDQVDIDGDGVISFDEFCEMMAVSMAEGGDERYLKEVCLSLFVGAPACRVCPWGKARRRTLTCPAGALRTDFPHL